MRMLIPVLQYGKSLNIFGAGEAVQRRGEVSHRGGKLV